MLDLFEAQLLRFGRQNPHRNRWSMCRMTALQNTEKLATRLEISNLCSNLTAQAGEALTKHTQHRIPMMNNSTPKKEHLLYQSLHYSHRFHVPAMALMKEFSKF